MSEAARDAETGTAPDADAADTATATDAAGSGRIVVGVDGSDPSLQALRWAVRQAALTGAVLEAVIAWEMPSAYGWGGLPALPEDFDLEATTARVLDDAIEKALTPEQAATVTRRTVLGNAAQTILDRGEGADLIVVGVRGHGTFRATLLGSVSHTVTLHASCPVVVVRGSATV
ncbi:Nucleotide-binding universal stress protein, UspA family [Actinacidiphila alni]|uniref:Nucleotide-binding universal stress protein, UspA family n=1 Tax=Actinacidiphila alni TaxID=380248 RepID=A0A1I2JFP3_9ACTN|nr:universal stress protein [Actinacidiphila alni]SFF52918.1 Nucleotide-binding universal stress protein, UspA family [Actinacidiphila alni]